VLFCCASLRAVTDCSGKEERNRCAVEFPKVLSKQRMRVMWMIYACNTVTRDEAVRLLHSCIQGFNAHK
jgi:hypothetical protein